MCKHLQEYNTFIRYLMSIVISGHLQQTQPGRACMSEDGVRRPCHHNHKTGAQLALEPAQHKLFTIYMPGSFYTALTNNIICYTEKSTTAQLMLIVVSCSGCSCYMEIKGSNKRVSVCIDVVVFSR